MFWEATRRELAEVAPQLERHPLPQQHAPHLELEHLSFLSLGGVRVHGYQLYWKDGGKRPLVIHSHGYNSECSVMWEWAEAGLNVVGVDIRGFGRSRDALPKKSKWGFMLTGVEAPDRYVLRGAICDYMRAAEVGRELLAGRVERTVLHGASFAGGLALMSESVLQVADLLAVGVPTFGWAEGRQFFVQSGSGREINEFLTHRPEHAEDMMVVMRYFDPINFAGLVRCPTLLGVGIEDEVVPAPTVFAIANHLGGPHEVMEFPVSHTELPEEVQWQRFGARWLQLATKGVPAGFGEAASH